MHSAVCILPSQFGEECLENGIAHCHSLCDAIHQSQGRHAEALDALRCAKKIKAVKLGPTNIAAVECVENLGAVNLATGAITD